MGGKCSPSGDVESVYGERSLDDHFWICLWDKEKGKYVGEHSKPIPVYDKVYC